MSRSRPEPTTVGASTPTFPDEAVEAIAEALWNEREFRDPSSQSGPYDAPTPEPILWARVLRAARFERERDACRSDARKVLDALTPFLVQGRVAWTEADVERLVDEVDGGDDGDGGGYGAEFFREPEKRLRELAGYLKGMSTWDWHVPFVLLIAERIQQPHLAPLSEQDSGGGVGSWCGGCGLKLSAGMPPAVWTGHVHNPVSATVMDAAWSLYAVVEALKESGEDKALRAASEVLQRKLDDAGVSEMAVRMYGQSATAGSRT